RDEIKLSVLRGLSAAFTNELVATKRKPDEELTDDEAIAVIKKQAKQRRESIEQFKSGGRNELAEKEEKELAILSEYLPEEMSRQEIEKIANIKKAELGVTDKSKMGILMGAVMKETKGKADGAVVKEVVDLLF
ncbi:MAG TPA: GatB/YqeY domain-containing protein, partial [Candidatus Paceibacterota bacterium]|nr:GatB/YqeY domain-containing protein [Candidatus Paceibacterota bacterium]